jgi:hypothetical protein
VTQHVQSYQPHKRASASCGNQSMRYFSHVSHNHHGRSSDAQAICKRSSSAWLHRTITKLSHSAARSRAEPIRHKRTTLRQYLSLEVPRVVRKCSVENNNSRPIKVGEITVYKKGQSVHLLPCLQSFLVGKGGGKMGGGGGGGGKKEAGTSTTSQPAHALADPAVAAE